MFPLVNRDQSYRAGVTSVGRNPSLVSKLKVHLGPVWVLEDWWPIIRCLTIYKEFCRVFFRNMQYGWIIKKYIAYNKEKEKIHKDSWGLWRFYFICVINTPYYQEGHIGWVSIQGANTEALMHNTHIHGPNKQLLHEFLCYIRGT
jgi:hypothetical protein